MAVESLNVKNSSGETEERCDVSVTKLNGTVSSLKNVSTF